MSQSSEAPQIRLGLGRVLPLLARLGSPHTRFPVIHIAGTNSKGTTSAILDAALVAMGIRTARFNSPHLRYPRDSCKITGATVDEAAWSQAGAAVKEANETHPHIEASDFECLFAQFLVACCNAPMEHLPEVLIVECGLGGLTDATNVFPADAVLASVITPIGLDHKGLLGETLSQIAEQKMGIAKRGGLVVVAEQQAVPPMTQAPASRGWDSESDSPSAVDRDASEVLRTIRRVAESLRARLIRCRAPIVLKRLSTEARRDTWQVTQRYRVALAPILQLDLDTTSTETSASYDTQSLASTLFTDATFHAPPGAPALTTPLLPPLPNTAAVQSALSTALCTLCAVATDEPRSARLQGGSDAHEDLRLRMAYALRDSGLWSGEMGSPSDALSTALVNGVTSWEGRGSWVSWPRADELMPNAGSGATDSMDVDCQAPTTPSRRESVQILVDGAHNVPALRALLRHVHSLLYSDGLSKIPSANTDSSNVMQHRRRIDVRLVLSFSSSKETDGDLDGILDLIASMPAYLNNASQEAAPGSDESNHLAQNLHRSLALVDSKEDFKCDATAKATPPSDWDVHVHVGFVAFETPVEGMPWVKPIDHTALAASLSARIGSSSGVSVSAHSSLSEALKEVGQSGVTGTLATGPGEVDSLVIVSGSLYLVGELYRLLDQLKK